jgi:cytoskeletal protein CcmA (bactofilin family)
MLRCAILASCLLALLTSSALATEFRVGDAVSVGPEEVIDDDLLVAGTSVLVAGEVKGDLIGAGRTVRITGPVVGSVLVAGQHVQVSGKVDGSVRAAGEDVALEGAIGRNAAVLGQTLVLGQSSRVARDLHGAGRTLDLDGSVGRRAAVAGETATMRGHVGQQLYFEGTNLTLGPSAQVGGDVIYRSLKPATVAAGAKIGGRTEQLPPRHPSKVQRKPNRILPAVYFLLMFFASGVVGLAAAPRLVCAAADAMVSRPWWNPLLGLLTLIVVPIGALLVCITLIGIPLAILVLVLWVAALVFSAIPVSIFLGRVLLGRGISPYLALLLGLVALTLVGLVPILGRVVKLLTILFGLGVYARASKGMLTDMRRQAA